MAAQVAVAGMGRWSLGPVARVQLASSLCLVLLGVWFGGVVGAGGVSWIISDGLSNPTNPRPQQSQC